MSQIESGRSDPVALELGESGCISMFIALVSILEIYHSLASLHGITNIFVNRVSLQVNLI